MIKRPGKQANAFECKINPDRFDPANLKIFRSLYPEGKNYVLSPVIKTSYQRHYDERLVTFISISHLFKVA
jgi:uncharacterized protein